MDSKEHPAEPPAVEEEQIVSSNEVLTAISASDWDALVSQARGLPIAHSSSAGVSRFERDSVYLKFDPLFGFSTKQVGASGSAPADRLSSVLKVPKLPEPSQGATGGNGVNGNKVHSHAKKPATRDEFSSSTSKGTQRCSEASCKYYSATSDDANTTLYTTALDTTISEASSHYYSATSDVANTTLYTTALDTTISPFTDNLEEALIDANHHDVKMDQGALTDSSVNGGSGAN